MAVTLPTGLFNKVYTRVGDALDHGIAPEVLLGEIGRVWRFEMTATSLEGKTLTYLVRAAEHQTPGDASGPLCKLADYIGLSGDAIAAELRGLALAPAQPAGADPFAARRIGPQRRLLLDHEAIRSALRDTVTGELPVVWVPPPMGLARRPCEELALFGAPPDRWRVWTLRWVPAAYADERALATEIASTFGLGALPEAGLTTAEAEIRGLARWLVSGLMQQPPGKLIIASGFQQPGCPTRCLQLWSWMMEAASGASGPNRLRLVLLDFEPGEAWVPEFDMDRTQPELPDAARLRAEAAEVLAAAGVAQASIDAALERVRWTPDPLDLEGLHLAVRAALKAHGGAP